MRLPIRPASDGLLLQVRVTPKGGNNAVDGVFRAADGNLFLKVKVRAAPEKGKANKAIIETLADSLGLPASRFRIIAGEAARQKSILVSGNAAELQALIAAFIQGLEQEGS